MKQYQTILFDLDGTLTDSAVGITNSIIYALERYGISVADRVELYKFIGPPLIDSFQKYYSFSPEKARQAADIYHEYYNDTGIFENQLYAGIPELLEELKHCGKHLVVASAKPEVLVKRILHHFGLYDYFDFIGGADRSCDRMHKTKVVKYVLDAIDSADKSLDKSQLVMVGDREDDVQGALQNGLDCLGVLYGFGSREELQTAGATYLAESVEQLRTMLRDGI